MTNGDCRLTNPNCQTAKQFLQLSCISMNEAATSPAELKRYDAVSQILHWATAVLVFYAFSNSLGGNETRVYLPSRDFQRQLHETAGFLALVLVAIRVLWR